MPLSNLLNLSYLSEWCYNFFYLSVSTQTNGEKFGWWSSHVRIINNGSDGGEIEEFAPKLVV